MNSVESDNAFSKSCGWNRPGGKTGVRERNVGSGKVRLWRGAVAGLSVVALAMIGYFLFSPSSVPVKPDAEAGKGKSRLPDSKPSLSPASRTESKAKPKTVEDALANFDEQPKPAMKMRKLSDEEWNRLTNRTFSTGTEQLMSWVFSVELGDMPMPIPSISEEDRKNLAAILISKNPIDEEKDDEMTKICKEQVQLAKKEMAKYIGEGGDPDDFLQYYFKELKNAFEFRNEAIRQCEELAEEDPAMASEFVKKINGKFARDGIKPIPDNYAEKDDGAEE